MNGVAALLLTMAAGATTGLGPSFVTYLRTKRTDVTKQRIAEGGLELDERRADGEAYERAQKINQEIVQSLERQVERLEQTIDGLRADLAELRERNGELVERNTELAGHIRELEQSAATMRQLLRRAGIDYPPPAAPTYATKED
jgi:TolA-binding protein